MILKRLLQHSVLYGVAMIVARGAQVATLLVLPSFLLPAEYGAIQIILTVALLANLLLPLEVTQGLVRFLPSAAEEDKNSYIASAWWFTIASVSLALLLAQLLAPQLCQWVLGDIGKLAAFRLGLVLIYLNAIFYFVQNQFRWIFDPAGFVVVSLIFAIATSALTLGLAANLPSALIGALAGQVIGMAAAVAVGFVRLAPSLLGVPRKQRLTKMLRYSLPLVPAQLALFGSLYLGRLVLNDLESLTEVGLFTLASQIAGIGSLLVVGIQAALTPMVMKHHEAPETPAILARLFEAFVAGALLLTLFLALFSADLIALLGQPAYRDAAPLVLVMAPAALVAQFYVFAPGFAVGQRTDRQLWVSLIGATVSLVANYALIGMFGVWGAAFATLLGATAFTIFWYALSHSLYPIPIRWPPVTAALVLAAAIFSVPALWDDFNPPLPIKLLLLASLAIVLLLLKVVAPDVWRMVGAGITDAHRRLRIR